MAEVRVLGEEVAEVRDIQGPTFHPLFPWAYTTQLNVTQGPLVQPAGQEPFTSTR